MEMTPGDFPDKNSHRTTAKQFGRPGHLPLITYFGGTSGRVVEAQQKNSSPNNGAGRGDARMPKRKETADKINENAHLLSPTGFSGGFM